MAKYLGVYWQGNIGNLRADDVGEFQVRTCQKDHHCLILHKKDPDNRIFISVKDSCPKFILRGWIRGVDGKQEKFWKDPKGDRPAYFVPVASLQPMESLNEATPDEGEMQV